MTPKPDAPITSEHRKLVALITTEPADPAAQLLANALRDERVAVASGKTSMCLRIDHMHRPELGCWDYLPIETRRKEVDTAAHELALERARAEGRLVEFDYMKEERPLDPIYWDMHHRRDLVERVERASIAAKEKEQ